MLIPSPSHQPLVIQIRPIPPVPSPLHPAPLTLSSIQAGIFHFSLLKRNAALKDLILTQFASHAASTATEFLITRDGIWLPWGHSDSAAPPLRYALLSGQHSPDVRLVVASSALGEHIKQLSARDTALRCNTKRFSCPDPPPSPAFPCVVDCTFWDNVSRLETDRREVEERQRCRRALARHQAHVCTLETHGHNPGRAPQHRASRERPGHRN